MMSEREYNRGAPELECKADIEWSPHQSWPTLPITFTLYYEMDGSCKVNGAVMDGQEDDSNMLDSFTEEQYAQAELACIDDYNYRCEEAAAWAEDYADWREGK